MAQDVTLVTGASSGIGESLARRIAQEHRPLVLVARRADRLEALARELRDRHQADAHVLAADLTKAGAIAGLLAEIDRQGLVVDWLVNNAGFGTSGRFDKLPVDGELEEIRLNVEALVELTGRCLPAMVQRGRGAVVNVASVAAYMPSPYMATYAATKAFVLSFTEALVVELRGTGVQALCVCPGFTKTEFQDVAKVDSNAVPAMAWMTSDAVADDAVRAVMRGESGVLVNGRMNSAFATLTKLVPRGALARVVGASMRGRVG
jgi:short-subunit dehydrogenase